MKIASFNINGIKARLHQLTAWLPDAQPDVVVLQEIKSVDEGFPSEVIEDLGWTVWTHGQKSWNGVAILSRLPVEDVSRGLPGDEADEQSRGPDAGRPPGATARRRRDFLPARRRHPRLQERTPADRPSRS